MIKMLFTMLGAALMSGAMVAESIEVNGDFQKLDSSSRVQWWSRNTWDGFKPYAKAEFKESDGKKVLHISEVTAKYGAGWRCEKLIPAQAGDEIIITARVRGRGSCDWQLNYMDAQKKFIVVSDRIGKMPLTENWQDCSVTLKVGNAKKIPTVYVLAAFSIARGKELEISDIRVSYNRSDIAGTLVFPREWFLYGKVDASLKPPLDEIPEEIGGAKPVRMVMSGNTLSFREVFGGERKLKNCGWAYARLESPFAGDYTVAAGADFFMAYYVNGVKVIDTLLTGNRTDPPHFSNFIATVKLNKGVNILAVKLLSGNSANPVLTLGGPNELRNMSSTIKVTDVLEQDDYEQPAERIGKPELIRDHPTPGLLTLTGQAVYGDGAVVGFAGPQYQLPPISGGKLFLLGIRLQKLSDGGSFSWRLGKQHCLMVSRKNDQLEAAITSDGQTLKRLTMLIKALPADLLWGAGRNDFQFNVTSLADSQLRTMSGKWNWQEDKFNTELKVAGEITVDNYLVGLGSRELADNAVPFKIELAPEFDPVRAGWPLKWSDEFDREVDWQNEWMDEPWQEKEQNRDLILVRNGIAHIRAEMTNDKKRPRVGRMFSRKRFGYGYFEARLRMTRHPGWWAGFWLYDEGRSMVNGGGYEIDIMEDYTTRNGENILASNLHTVVAESLKSFGYVFPLPGLLDDFYTIGCKWTPFEVSVYLNGKLVKSSSRFAPWQSVTFDAIHNALGMAPLYICLSGQAGLSKSQEAFTEDFLVDYIRYYEYPRTAEPKAAWENVPAANFVKPGEKFTLSVKAEPSSESKAPITGVYLFDSGYLLDFKTAPPYHFEWAIDQPHYAATRWDVPGRSGGVPKLTTYPHLFVAAVQDAAGKVVMTEPWPVICGSGTSVSSEPIPTIPGMLAGGQYDQGGQGLAWHKVRPGKAVPYGNIEELFSRKYLTLRESGEWVRYTVDAKEAGDYRIVLKRREYRRNWPLRAYFFVDNRLAGEFSAAPDVPEAVLDDVQITGGRHTLTLMSACAFGVHPSTIVFERKP
jgi:hypothetical protein